MNRNSKHKSTKGFIQIDLAFVILIFFILFLTIHNLNKSNITGYEYQFEKNKLNMQARDICLLITSTPGEPQDWENKTFNQTKLLGLRETSNNSLSSNKINKLKTQTYLNITDKFNTNSYSNIKIKGLETNTNYLKINADTQNKTIRTGNYVCYSNYNSEIVEVLIETWK